MKKFFVCLPALALAVILSGNAMAENGTVDNATLQAMGLGGMQVMSDDAALAVRGKGFLVGNSASLAFGASYATAGAGGLFSPNSSGTIDGFLADGKFMAEGSHLSEAGWSRTLVNELEVKGLPAIKETTTRSFRIYAGGTSSASSL